MGLIDMEEVTLHNKYSLWKVIRKGHKMEVCKTSKPMTSEDALKHFSAIGVIGIITKKNN